MGVCVWTEALINDEHTLRDFGAAITNSDVISMPEPNTTLLAVPGRNGRLDLSEVLTGDVSYGNRELKLVLAAETNIERWQTTCLHIFNKYHGRNVTVVFDDDTGHYYVGRAAVSDPHRLRNAGQLTITVDAEPFRYENEQTEITLSGTTTAFDGILPNARMPVSPEVDVPTACTLMHGDDIFTLKAGRQPVPGFVLHEGDNRVSITGARSATFYYRKGCL